MDRREWLGMLSAGAVGLIAASESEGQAEHAGHGDKAHRDCMKACADCMNECNATFHHCFELVEAGHREHARAAHVAADCAEFCKLSATMVGRQSPLMGYACQSCAEACQMCASECDKLQSAQMKECARSCRDCEKACRDMLTSMRGQPTTAAPRR